MNELAELKKYIVFICKVSIFNVEIASENIKLTSIALIEIGFKYLISQTKRKKETIATENSNEIQNTELTSLGMVGMFEYYKLAHLLHSD